MCRRAFLEQAKHERVGMQNGLQNGHMQNSEAHINGHANGHAEHTLDIEVTLSANSVPLCNRISVIQGDLYASWLGSMPSVSARSATALPHSSSRFLRALPHLFYFFSLSSQVAQVAHPCLALAALRGATTLLMGDGFCIAIPWLLNKAAYVLSSDADNQGCPPYLQCHILGSSGRI